MRISDWSSDVCSSDLLTGDGTTSRSMVLALSASGLGSAVWDATFCPRPAEASIAGYQRSARRERLRTGSGRSEEHTSELQSLMRTSYAVFCLNKKNTYKQKTVTNKLQQ